MVFDVRGMTCSACSDHVEKSVRKLDGIRSVTVSLLTNSMEVDFDPARTGPEAICRAVASGGYSASPRGAKAEKAAMEKKLPDYNENGYFRNLESAMRESLIGAQRIADETITEAKKKAQQTVADANAQAEKTIADATEQAEAATARAEKAVSELKAEEERLHAVVDAYRNNFQKLLDEQLEALTASEALLK